MIRYFFNIFSSLLSKTTNKTTFTIKFAPFFFDPNQILSAYRYYQLVEVYPLLLYQEENALSSFGIGSTCNVYDKKSL